MTVTTPLMRYHGGKFRLAPWIIAHFPPMSAFDVYVEPYGGAAGVLLQKPRSYAEVYNDLDGDVVNLFEVLRSAEQRQCLIEQITLTPYARGEFEQAFEAIEDPVESARRMLIRAYMGFGSAGATKGNTGFRIDTQRSYSIAPHHWARLPGVIGDVAERLTGVLIENRDALEVLIQHDSPRTLHYVDPPYLHATRVMASHRRYYRHEMNEPQHAALLTLVKQLKGFVLLSAYASEQYAEALSGWTTVRTTSRISAGRGTATRHEHLWLNPRAAEWTGQMELAFPNLEVAHG